MLVVVQVVVPVQAFAGALAVAGLALLPRRKWVVPFVIVLFSFVNPAFIISLSVGLSIGSVVR